MRSVGQTKNLRRQSISTSFFETLWLLISPRTARLFLNRSSGKYRVDLRNNALRKLTVRQSLLEHIHESLVHLLYWRACYFG